MPKDEFDFDDPLELNGVAIFSQEDTTGIMAECLIEEFMRLGYNHKQLSTLFRNPHYIGMNMILQNRGEGYVREKIAEVFARWGRPVEWPAFPGAACDEHGGGSSHSASPLPDARPEPDNARNQEIELDSRVTDPMGAPIPKLNL